MSSTHAAPVIVSPPSVHAVPVVLDSPHSGTWYPDKFDHVVDRLVLRQAEDTHVEKLFAGGPAHGATLIAANFPRSYIDPNRSLLDIDNALLAAPWPGPVNPSKKTAKGIGLVWRKLDSGHDIYNRKLEIAEVAGRVRECYSPYHAAVRDALNAAVEHYGAVWHINCHSMPAVSGQISDEGPGVARADFVLGDRDGTTCAPEFTQFIAAQLRAFGYDVKINDPYKGVELVRAYSDPAQHRHSLQMEINRKLYMDEKTREPNANFAKLKAHLDQLLANLCAYAVAHAPGHHHPHCDHDHGHAPHDHADDHHHGHHHDHDHKHSH